MNRNLLLFPLVALLGLLLTNTAFPQSVGRNGPPADRADISLHVASHWGGPINAAVVEGNRAYIANGRMFRILDLTDESNPVEMGSLELGGGRAAIDNVAGDGVRDIELRGNYAYVTAVGEQFFNIVDITNPHLPNLIRSFARFGHGGYGSVARHVQLFGDYAYVDWNSGGSYGIEVFDIRNPLNVAPAGSINSSGTSILVHDGKLYRGSTGGLSSSPTIRVYDITANPTNPPLIGSLAIPQLMTYGLTAVGDHLYLAVKAFRDGIPPDIGLSPGDHGLATVSIADPAQPILIHVVPDFSGLGFNIASDAVRMAATDGLVFVHDRPAARVTSTAAVIAGGLRVFDIATDPAAPAPVTTFREHGDIYGAFAATATRAYVADAAEGLLILDITDPRFPARVGKYHSPEVLGKAVLDGDLLYVEDHDGGFTVLDVSAADAPRVVGNYLVRRHHDYRTRNLGIDKAGDVVYLAAGHSGLVTVDVSDPARPRTMGVLRTTGMAIRPSNRSAAMVMGVKQRDGFAFVGYTWLWCQALCGGGQLLLTVDVSNPYQPIDVGWIQPNTFGPLPDNIAFDGTLATHTAMGELIDLANPLSPQRLSGFYDHLSGYDAVSVSSGIALFDNLRLLTIWHPMPEDTPGSLYQLLRQHDGLHIQDVSNPGAPATLRWIKADEPVPGCGIFPRVVVNLHASPLTRRAYVRSANAFFVFDISDPTQPHCLHRLDGFSDGNAGEKSRKWVTAGELVWYSRFDELLVEEPRVYSTSSTLGLSVLEVQGLEPARIAVEAKTLTATLDAGEQQTVPLRIRNEGGSALHWHLDTTVRGCDDPAALGWLRLAPDAGSIGPNGSAIPTVSFDAAGRKPGSHSATLCLRSNDPARPITHVEARLDIRSPTTRK